MSLLDVLSTSATYSQILQERERGEVRGEREERGPHKVDMWVFTVLFYLPVCLKFCDEVSL